MVWTLAPTKRIEAGLPGMVWTLAPTTRRASLEEGAVPPARGPVVRDMRASDVVVVREHCVIVPGPPNHISQTASLPGVGCMYLYVNVLLVYGHISSSVCLWWCLCV